MGLLTDDINKIGGILIEDYYTIEITGMYGPAYDQALLDGHPGETLEYLHQVIGDCVTFENILWKYNKDFDQLISSIGTVKMPFDESPEWIKQYIAEKIRQLLGNLLDTNEDFGWGRQIRDNWISVGAVYNFKRGGMFQIVRIKLTEK